MYQSIGTPNGIPNDSGSFRVDEEITLLRKALHDLGHKVKSNDKSLVNRASKYIFNFFELWGLFCAVSVFIIWFIWLICNPCSTTEDEDVNSIACASKLEDIKISPALIILSTISISGTLAFIGYRYMEIHKNVSSIAEDGRNLVIRLTSVISVATRNANNDTSVRLEAEEAIRHIHRYMLLSQTLLYTHELCGSYLFELDNDYHMSGTGHTLAVSHSGHLESEGLILAMEENLLLPQEADFFAQGDCSINSTPFVVYGWAIILLQRIAISGLIGPYPTSAIPMLSDFMNSMDRIQIAASRIKQLCASSVPLPLRLVAIALLLLLLLQGLSFSAALVVESQSEHEIIMMICGFVGSIVFIIACLVGTSLGGRPSLDKNVLRSRSPRAYLQDLAVETESVLDAMLASAIGVGVVPRVRVQTAAGMLSSSTTKQHV